MDGTIIVAVVSTGGGLLAAGIAGTWVLSNSINKTINTAVSRIHMRIDNNAQDAADKHEAQSECIAENRARIRQVEAVCQERHKGQPA